MSDSSTTSSSVQETPEALAQPPTASSGRPFARAAKFAVGTVVFGIALFFGLNYLAENWARESTDDAFVDGHVVSIAARVSAQVLATHITENQKVKAGDLLVELDPAEFEVRVSQKRAALQSSKANQQAIEAGFELMRARMKTAEATRKQSEAEAEAARSTYDNAVANWERAQNLWTNLAQQVISAQELDTVRAAMTTAKANWEADVQKAASDASKVTESQAQLTTAEKLYDQAGAQIGEAQANLKQAELELSYTKIVAPVDGRVTRKMVEKGAYVQAGQILLAIVRPEIWVTANFKETQTANIRPGQPVRIKVDGMSGRTFRGHVDSLQSGSGARFSLLPPENAVGNYVKVVQRVPVKILFDDPVEATGGLGPGMSVVPSVEIGKRPFSSVTIAIFVIIFVPVCGFAAWSLAQRRAKNHG